MLLNLGILVVRDTAKRDGMSPILVLVALNGLVRVILGTFRPKIPQITPQTAKC